MSDKEFGRRAMLELLGGFVLLAACSDQTGTSHSGSTATGRAGSTSSVAETGVTVDASGAKLATGLRATAEQLQREREQIGGTWLGSWRDDQGGHGNVDGIFDIDVAGRAIDFTLKIDGPFLGGSGPTTTTYHLDADALSRNDDDVTLQSPLVGPFDLQFLGFGQFQLTATDVPGHDDISSLVIKGAWETIDTGSMTYEVKGSGPAAGRGAVAWSRSGKRPAAPAIGSAADDLTTFIGGDYAATLILTAEASKLLGQPCKAPVANGGRAGFPAPQINISNGRVETVAPIIGHGGAVIQYAIYRAPDAAAMKAWFHRYYDPYPAVAGVGHEAHALRQGAGPISNLYVRNGRESLDLNIVREHQTLSPSQQEALFVAVAKVILARMQ